MIALTIEATRVGYSLHQVGSTMTVRELIDFLEQYKDETKVYISNDGGYTYGAIKESLINEEEIDDDEENVE